MLKIPLDGSKHDQQALITLGTDWLSSDSKATCSLGGKLLEKLVAGPLVENTIYASILVITEVSARSPEEQNVALPAIIGLLDRLWALELVRPEVIDITKKIVLLAAAANPLPHQEKLFNLINDLSKKKEYEVVSEALQKMSGSSSDRVREFIIGMTESLISSGQYKYAYKVLKLWAVESKEEAFVETSVTAMAKGGFQKGLIFVMRSWAEKSDITLVESVERMIQELYNLRRSPEIEELMAEVAFESELSQSVPNVIRAC